MALDAETQAELDALKARSRAVKEEKKQEIRSGIADSMAQLNGMAVKPPVTVKGRKIKGSATKDSGTVSEQRKPKPVVPKPEPVAIVPSAPIPAPTKKRGRPAGSKNIPKTGITEKAEAAASARQAAVILPIPTIAPIPEINPKVSNDRIYFFSITPDSKTQLRCYFVALMAAQFGGIENIAPLKKFRLWPGANFRTHIKMRKLIPMGEDFYYLSEIGYKTFFREQVKMLDPIVYAEFVDAVASGKPPGLWNIDMMEL